MPILQVLHHKDVTNTMVVVVRYFGAACCWGARWSGACIQRSGRQGVGCGRAVSICPSGPLGVCRRLRPLGQAGSFFAIVGYQLEQTDYGAEVLCQGLSREEAWESFFASFV